MHSQSTNGITEGIVAKAKFKKNVIPYIPDEVALSDLHPKNIKLLSEEEILDLKSRMTADGRYSKVESNTKYTIIVQGGKYFAVYSGKKGHRLGEGTTAHVKLAQNLETGKWVALKVQPPFLMNSPSITAENELKQLTDAKQIIKAGSEPVAFERYSQSKKRIQHYMLMKLGKGKDLFDFATDFDLSLSCIMWIKIAQKILKAVNQLHNKNMIHRDIKLENIRYESATGKLLLIDFGFAITLDANGEFEIEQHCGTINYIAPEVLTTSGKINYNKKMDVYSLGITLAIIFDLAHVSHNGSMIELCRERSSEFRDNTRIPDIKIRKEIFDFIKKMLSLDPANRPTVQEALDFMIKIENKLSPKDKVVRVAFLDIAEFNAAKARDCLNDWAEKLRDVNQVWLVDPGKVNDPLYYVRVRRELEVLGINVCRKIYHNMPCDKLIACVPNHMAKKQLDYLYEYSYVKDGKLISLSETRQLSTTTLFQKLKSKMSDKLALQPAIQGSEKQAQTKKRDLEIPIGCKDLSSVGQGSVEDMVSQKVDSLSFFPVFKSDHGSSGTYQESQLPQNKAKGVTMGGG